MGEGQRNPRKSHTLPTECLDLTFLCPSSINYNITYRRHTRAALGQNGLTIIPLNSERKRHPYNGIRVRLSKVAYLFVDFKPEPVSVPIGDISLSGRWQAVPLSFRNLTNRSSVLSTLWINHFRC